MGEEEDGSRPFVPYGCGYEGLFTVRKENEEQQLLFAARLSMHDVGLARQSVVFLIDIEIESTTTCARFLRVLCRPSPDDRGGGKFVFIIKVCLYCFTNNSIELYTTKYAVLLQRMLRATSTGKRSCVCALKRPLTYIQLLLITVHISYMVYVRTEPYGRGWSRV